MRSDGLASVIMLSLCAACSGSDSMDAEAMHEPQPHTDASDANVATAQPAEKFSFFITSLQGMRDLSQSEQGFGGDLRYGEPTGLAGADKICTELAERSLPGSGDKGWRAFLSTAMGAEDGGPTHAKDRIGQGPWYDRMGRLVAMDLGALLQERPAGADPTIASDLPNERGEPNHTDTIAGMDDNHDIITGTNAQGMYDGHFTCADWTSTDTPVPPATEMPDESMPAPPTAGGAAPTFPGGFRLPDFHGPGLGHSWPSAFSGTSWFAAHRALGCGASVALVQTGPGEGVGIGNAGGYGGIYCFALKP
jgi:hypothetical protein